MAAEAVFYGDRMADDLTKRGPQDRSKVNLNERWEVDIGPGNGTSPRHSCVQLSKWVHLPRQLPGEEECARISRKRLRASNKMPLAALRFPCRTTRTVCVGAPCHRCFVRRSKRHDAKGGTIEYLIECVKSARPGQAHEPTLPRRF
jgi:hypothetical protein